jgi:hypothetical protein
VTTYKTKYGPIYYDSSRCRDSYPNIKLYDQPPRGGSPLKLQAAAIRALKAAQREYAKRSGWEPERIKRNPDGRVIAMTGTWRSCEYQAELYRRDPRRYASPAGTGHTRGIAIDVSMSQPNLDKIWASLRKIGWEHARPDEPWHWTWGPAV